MKRPTITAPSAARTASFDEEYRALLGPRPQRSDPEFATKNREWDRRYAELFPSNVLPSYLPKWNKRGTRNRAA
jgi:hypothetical protein